MIYTDGLIEGRNLNGTVYGSDRLGDRLLTVAHLDPASLIDNLVAHETTFGGGRQDDDRTLLYCRNAT